MERRVKFDCFVALKKGDRLLFLYELSSIRDYSLSSSKSSLSLFIVDSLKGGQSG